MNDGSGGTERRLRIFINYRRADSAPYAGRRYDGLVAQFVVVRTENTEPPNALHFA